MFGKDKNEKIPLVWTVDNLQKAEENEIEKNIKEMPLTEIGERMNLIDKFTHNPQKEDLLIGSQRFQRRRKLLHVWQLLKTEQDSRFRAQDKVSCDKTIEWRNTFVRENFRDFRATYGLPAEHLHDGSISQDVANFAKIPAVKFDITNTEGKRITVDLEKIPPEYLRIIAERTLTPIYVYVERAGIFKKGDTTPQLWLSSDYGESKKLEFRHQTVMALMRV